MLRKGSYWVMAAALLMALPAAADYYTFQPNPSDLWDLDHDYYYRWGLGTSWLDANEVITSASLFFDNIANWQTEPNDLYVHLLNTAPVGTRANRDYWSGDYFATTYTGQHQLLEHYVNLPATPQDITYNFTADEIALLTSYMADGNFGFGFDPDCHYNNCGITFRVTTAVVPEPATLSLLGLGMAGLAVRRIRRKSA